MIREWLTNARRDFAALEPVLVDGFATVSPWLTAVFPAALTGWNVATHLIAKWPDALRLPVAATAALAVESVGIAAVHSLVREWSKGKSASAKLIALAGVAELYYLAAIITVNVIVEAAQGQPAADVAARGILSTMSVVGALVIAVRAQAADGELQKQEVQEKRNATRVANRVASQVANATESQQPQPEAQHAPQRLRGAQLRAALAEWRNANPDKSKADAARHFGVDPATITRNWK